MLVVASPVVASLTVGKFGWYVVDIVIYGGIRVLAGLALIEIAAGIAAVRNWK